MNEVSSPPQTEGQELVQITRAQLDQLIKNTHDLCRISHHATQIREFFGPIITEMQGQIPSDMQAPSEEGKKKRMSGKVMGTLIAKLPGLVKKMSAQDNQFIPSLVRLNELAGPHHPQYLAFVERQTIEPE